jgi:hypothetical protein
MARVKMAKGTSYTFRVSDSVNVPLRGRMLRLRLTEGSPSMKDLSVGETLRLTSPGGETRDVSILAHSVTSGIPTQKRLDRNRELDVIVSEEEATTGGVPIDIGWMARGPIEENR